MLPLGSSIPKDTAALRHALEKGLEPLGVGPNPLVIEGEFPNISALRLDLTGANFTRSMRPEKAGSERQPGFFARAVAIRATPAKVEGVPVHLTVDAEDVVFAFAKGDSGNWGLTIDRASRGEGELLIESADLEAMLLKVAKGAAEKQGAEIETVRLQFSKNGSRALLLNVSISAKAMFFTAKVGISGHLEITDSLEARLFDLTCQGEGMLGNMAAGFLRPHFAKLEGRTFPLASILPGLRTASLETTGTGIRIRATLGTTA